MPSFFTTAAAAITISNVVFRPRPLSHPASVLPSVLGIAGAIWDSWGPPRVGRGGGEIDQQKSSTVVEIPDYPGCQRSFRSPAARGVRASSAGRRETSGSGS